LDARHCLLFRVSFGLKLDGAEAGRDAGLGGIRHRQNPPRDARPHLHPLTPPSSPWRTALTALTLSESPSGGVGHCSHAGGYGCLLGRPRPRRIAGTIATVGSARGGRGAGSGPELLRMDRHQRRLRGRGSVGPDLSLARLLGGRPLLLIASSARLRWPGVTGSGAARIPPLRVGPGQRAGHTGQPTGSLESVDPRARAACATVSASDSRGRLPGGCRGSRGRCLLDCGARLGPGPGDSDGGPAGRALGDNLRGPGEAHDSDAAGRRAVGKQGAGFSPRGSRALVMTCVSGL
jgi:hypothetical protein